MWLTDEPRDPQTAARPEQAARGAEVQRPAQRGRALFGLDAHLAQSPRHAAEIGAGVDPQAERRAEPDARAHRSAEQERTAAQESARVEQRVNRHALWGLHGAAYTFAHFGRRPNFGWHFWLWVTLDLLPAGRDKLRHCQRDQPCASTRRGLSERDRAHDELRRHWIRNPKIGHRGVTRDDRACHGGAWLLLIHDHRS